MSSKFKAPRDAHFYYFPNWDELKKRNAKDLKTDAKIGSESGWKSFVKAVKKYKTLRLSNSHGNVFSRQRESYLKASDRPFLYD